MQTSANSHDAHYCITGSIIMTDLRALNRIRPVWSHSYWKQPIPPLHGSPYSPSDVPEWPFFSSSTPERLQPRMTWTHWKTLYLDGQISIPAATEKGTTIRFKSFFAESAICSPRKAWYLRQGADLRHVPGLTCFAEWTHGIASSTVTDFLPVDRHTDTD